MSNISNIDPDTLVLLSSIFSITVSKNLNNDQINVLGNVFAQIGASLLTKGAQQQSIQNKEELKQQIADMEQQFEKLKRQLR